MSQSQFHSHMFQRGKFYVVVRVAPTGPPVHPHPRHQSLEKRASKLVIELHLDTLLVPAAGQSTQFPI